MMTVDELRQIEADLLARMEQVSGFLDIPGKEAELAALEEKMNSADFWDDKEKAQATVAAASSCRNILAPYRKMQSEMEDFNTALELAGEDEEFLAEAETASKIMSAHMDKLEVVSFLSGRFDKNNFFLTIHAGAGGTESCDWGSILLRMYRRFAERNNWKEEMIDYQPGDEAGIRSATFRIIGDFAYGYCKGETGVHRLVRISPFDSNARRHTSFCSVEVIPEIDDDIDIEVNDCDIRVDTYRASGAGGQHVNTTDSAVRITHIPTGVVVACQNERSQHKNRATAMKMLKAKLYEMEERKRKDAAAAQRGEQMENGWGSQIRSYVLQPYQMVKDLRTDVETSDTAGVLDGELDRFVEAYLKWNR